MHHAGRILRGCRTRVFRWFGVFWSSLVKMSVLYFLLTYFWTYLVMRQVFRNKYMVLVLLIACESMTLILFSYWWYNPVTDMIVILYTASVAAVLLHPKNAWLWVSVCLSLFLAALMKPNVSGLAIIGGTCALLLNPGTRWRACAVSLIAFALWLCVVQLCGTVSPSSVGSYLAVSSRQFSNQQFLDGFNLQDLFAWACVCAVLPGLFGAAWHKVAGTIRLPFLILGIFALLATLAAFFGNGEAKLVDVSVGLLAMAILVGEGSAETPSLRVSRGWTAYLILVCSVFTFGSIVDAATRYRVYRLDPANFLSIKWMIPRSVAASSTECGQAIICTSRSMRSRIYAQPAMYGTFTLDRASHGPTPRFTSPLPGECRFGGKPELHFPPRTNSCTRTDGLLISSIRLF